ncbi:MAG TPA: lysine-sensitive aspartokinase 3 [Solibacterales bacterium]|nr:lysine-sensitive aspartokinase 3 [Bryobacterales bacterium]
MIVMKFGGTSVESAAAIKRVAGIVRGRLQRQPVVVVSAMGKTTNKLLAMGEAAAAGSLDEAVRQMANLRDYHLKEGRDVLRDEDFEALDQTLGSHFAELEALLARIAAEGALTPVLTDSLSAFGERLSSAIVALAFWNFGIPATQVDARRVVITDSRHTQAYPLYPRTYARLAEAVAPLARAGKVPVLGGFIGSTTDGATTTLGRGGSDLSAAIVGAGIDAEEIEIWTDVSGMLTCDPRVLPGGHRVKFISFAEAAELAYFGAKVLHPSTVLPAIEKNIPVLILNSRQPAQQGTRIVSESVACSNVIKSIACKPNITVMSVQSARMLMAYGFLRRIFEVFDRYRTPVDVVSTSEVSVSLTVDNTEHIDEIAEELRRIADVRIDSDLSIVCVVGDNVRGTPGIAARVFGALRDVNVRMISQGASLLNLTLVVSTRDLRRAVGALHEEFFSELDPLVFEPVNQEQAV